MPPQDQTPEQYLLSPTPFVPNSPFPVLVYRSVLLPSSIPSKYPESSSCSLLSHALTPQTIESFTTPNHWPVGGVFKTYRSHHFHSVTHECYAVFSGQSTLLLGKGPYDTLNGNETRVQLRKGDAIVLPAGVAHCSIGVEEDGVGEEYEYVGLYPVSV
jgi:uncharacterized protein YjlB